MKRSDIYKQLKNRLLLQIKGITVDVQRGQMDKPIKDYPFPMPLALVSLSKIKWEVLAEQYERGELTIIVDYYKNFVSSGMFSGAESEDETLDLLDSPEEIYRALGYFRSELFEELYRTEESEIRAGGCLIGFRIIFKTYIYQEDKQ